MKSCPRSLRTSKLWSGFLNQRLTTLVSSSHFTVWVKTSPSLLHSWICCLTVPQFPRCPVPQCPCSLAPSLPSAPMLSLPRAQFSLPCTPAIWLLSTMSTNVAVHQDWGCLVWCPLCLVSTNTGLGLAPATVRSRDHIPICLLSVVIRYLCPDIHLLSRVCGLTLTVDLFSSSRSTPAHLDCPIWISPAHGRGNSLPCLHTTINPRPLLLCLRAIPATSTSPLHAHSSCAAGCDILHSDKHQRELNKWHTCWCC